MSSDTAPAARVSDDHPRRAAIDVAQHILLRYPDGMAVLQDQLTRVKIHRLAGALGGAGGGGARGGRREAAGRLGVARSRTPRWLAGEEPAAGNRPRLDALEFVLAR